MPIKYNHVNFHNGYTFHAYMFLANSGQVDINDLLRQAGERAEADLKAEAASNSDEDFEAHRAAILSQFTAQHFGDVLKEWFEVECWPLLDDGFESFEIHSDGDVLDATDIKDCFLVPLAAMASQEIN